MEIFHYCAVQLKDRNLFVSCTNKALSSQKKVKSGAIYNDVENDPLDLMAEDDNNRSLSNSPTQASSPESLSNMVSQKEVDALFLQADDDDPFRYHIDHEYYDNGVNDHTQR